jgi:methionine aminopeptidase
MVLAIEPMFIDSENSKTSVLSDGWSVLAQGMCAHCEHTVLITENEPEILTRRY